MDTPGPQSIASPLSDKPTKLSLLDYESHPRPAHLKEVEPSIAIAFSADRCEASERHAIFNYLVVPPPERWGYDCANRWGVLTSQDISDIPSVDDLISAYLRGDGAYQRDWFVPRARSLHHWFVGRVFAGEERARGSIEPTIHLSVEGSDECDLPEAIMSVTPEGEFCILNGPTEVVARTHALFNVPGLDEWEGVEEADWVDWGLVERMMADLRYMLSL